MAVVEVLGGHLASAAFREENGHVVRDKPQSSCTFVHFPSQNIRIGRSLALMERYHALEPFSWQIRRKATHQSYEVVETTVPSQAHPSHGRLHDRLWTEHLGNDLKCGLLVAHKVHPITQILLDYVSFVVLQAHIGEVTSMVASCRMVNSVPMLCFSFFCKACNSNMTLLL